MIHFDLRIKYLLFYSLNVLVVFLSNYLILVLGSFFACFLNLLISMFDCIECFKTTFLRAHSWLNWVDEDDDEDEVGLKEKPEDTRYIKKIT